MVTILVFAVVAGTVFFVLRHMNRYAMSVDARLATLHALETGSRQLVPGVWTNAHISTLVNRLVPNGSHESQFFQQRLHQAGFYSAESLGNFFAAKILSMVAPPAVGLTLSVFGIVSATQGLMYGALCGCLGFAVPTLWLNWSIARRHRMLRRSLPDFLDLLVVCLESGLSLQGAIRRVTEELTIAHPELAREMSALLQDIELGATVDQALRRFAERSGNEEVRTLSAFLREASKFGTEVSDALRMHAETLRLQREQAAEEMAQKAAVKILAPTLLLVFPTIFVVLVGPAIIQIQEAFAK
jgi:tight adherence protein C